MAKNIDWQGIIFPDVPWVRLKKDGGGLAQFDDTTDADAIADDITLGKTAYVNNEKVVGTNQGGGGASNYVHGEFTVQDTQGVQEIDIPYTGNGYVIGAFIYVKDGLYDANTTWSTTILRYAVGFYMLFKRNLHDAPNYTDATAKNQGIVFIYYKSSASSAYAMGNTYNASEQSYRNNANPSDYASQCMKIVSNKKIKIFAMNNSYGFAKGFTYCYDLIYSE